MISSSQNSKIKLVRALAGRPKERRDAGAFLAEGVRLVEDALAANWPFRFVLYSDDLSERGKDLIKKLEAKNIEAEKVESNLLQSLSETETAQGIIAVLEFNNLPIPESPNFILIPDLIRDPGNLGTLLRSADAAGAQAVLIPPETTDAFAPKVVRAGMGAQFRLPIHAMSWEEINQFINTTLSYPHRSSTTSPKSVADLGETGGGMQIFIADMNGQSCWETDFKSPLALIVGGEAEGASETARKLANSFVKIPMAGETESLNAAVAGSVLMFEVMRQRSIR